MLGSLPESRVVIDSGASLSRPGPGAAGTSIEQRRVKGRLVAEALALGGIDAMALSASDWELGADFVRGLIDEHHLPVVAANLTCSDGPSIPASRTITVSGRKIGVVGVTDGHVPGCTVQPAGPALREAAAELSDVDFLVALVPMTDARDIGQVIMGEELGVDLLVDANNRSLQARPQQRSGAWWISAGGRGRHLGVAKLVFGSDSAEWAFAAGGVGDPDKALANARARRTEIAARAAKAPDAEARARYEAQIAAYEKRIAELEASAASEASPNQITLEVVALDGTVADHPATAALVAAGKDAIGATVDASPTAFVARKVPDGPFSGGELCATCHAGPHAQWSRTGHARAWQALVGENRAFDEECWTCHVTGARQAGGPMTPKQTGPFRDVQCEACHGPARAHAMTPDDAGLMPVRDPEVAVCRTCHDGERDGGRFDEATYLPRVVHGGPESAATKAP